MIDLVAAKKALIGVLADLANGGTLDGVQVAYSWPGARAERECVHGGRVTWEEAEGGLGKGDFDVSLQIEVHIVVTMPGGTLDESDARAAALGRAIENELGDSTLDDHPGVLAVRVSGGDIDHGEDDDGATSVMTVRVALDCYQP
jgi:hypothetical protein